MILSDKDKERFLSKVLIGSENECWPWQAYVNPGGYGRIQIQRQSRVAHRISWIVFNGTFDSSLYVCHTCDNPSCVNPNHLFLGTQHDNMQDCFNKKRHPFSKKETCPRGHKYDKVFSNGARGCSDCFNVKRKMWLNKNREKTRDQAKKNRNKNPEKYAAYYKKWLEKNYDKKLAYNRNRYAKLKGL